ncbi:GNAT family N-acetyltransferase [Cognatiluteimonas telluris]|jgi:ribosomal protein S18 acetylase RimI-like enzyme|uniref:GNAT family N-acetyltransferase n=1 Tax=Cognatiluteimonas telluris TaxID=1104775 RepID=UPI00140AB523|nr:GNAT family N-acetyltransferase [Lysobacter telluris]
MAQARVFPPPVPAAWLQWQGALPAGLCLRFAADPDLPFLRGLYARSRALELAQAPWPDAAKRAFCDNQFELQHRHYASHAPAAFLVVTRDGAAIGRLTLHWAADILRIVDLLLDAHARSLGIGTALLRWLQCAAIDGGFAAVELHVAMDNDRACRLYRRVGFAEQPSTAAGHRRMCWRPMAAATVS